MKGSAGAEPPGAPEAPAERAHAGVDRARAGAAGQRPLPGHEGVAAGVDRDGTRDGRPALREPDRVAERLARAAYDEVGDRAPARRVVGADPQQDRDVAAGVRVGGDHVGVPVARADLARAGERLVRAPERDGGAQVAGAGRPDRDEAVAPVGAQRDEVEPAEHARRPERPGAVRERAVEHAGAHGGVLVGPRERHPAPGCGEHELRRSRRGARDGLRRRPRRRGARGGGDGEEGENGDEGGAHAQGTPRSRRGCALAAGAHVTAPALRAQIPTMPAQTQCDLPAPPFQIRAATRSCSPLDACHAAGPLPPNSRQVPGTIW